ncbi:hypothetical protein PAXINDRAFT_84711 [Paxillus involutus ATCC 200175]|uniref:Uncharacterized protein n=1 Tax=Paxillus involutus ATCC 200175 TaxID=664439 RepID=A0A0C9TVF6_PAXIN|nr:hypothetical protein PAXINDRAFT_84711 [Paxillus involutus ATCC 200175]
MRTEWCKARARANRWAEEVMLLKEEMRRVLAFLDWHSKWWVSQAGRRTNLDGVLTEGLVAYALRQADIRCAMRESFHELWKHRSAPPNPADASASAT